MVSLTKRSLNMKGTVTISQTNYIKPKNLPKNEFGQQTLGQFFMEFQMTIENGSFTGISL